MKSRSGLALAAIISVIFLTAASSAGAQPVGPDYTGFGTAKFLRYLNAAQGERDKPPRIGLSISGSQAYNAVLDSGSTGIVVAAALIPNFDQLPSEGDVRFTYTSSGRIMIGRWVVTQIALVGEHGDFVTTEPMPVLGVTEVRCLENARDCRPNDAPRDIAMVGIGFGREGNRESHSTPDKNPLLRIAWPGESGGNVRHGYILTKDGIHIGLTRANTERFGFIKLEREEQFADWAAVPACMVINGAEPPACGSMLVDTGVSAMFMTLPESQAGGASGTLPDGAAVSIRAGTHGNEAELYRFTVGDASPLAPSAIHLEVSPERTYVNTSVHLLNGFDVLYDADGGYAGFRPRRTDGESQ